MRACVYARMCVVFPTPTPEQYVVNVRNIAVDEANKPPEPEVQMAVQVANITVKGDAPFGGYFVTGIEATNRNGHPRDPQPTADKWSSSTDDASNETRMWRQSDGSWFLKVDDSRTPGEVVQLKVSSDPDIDGDDAVINVTYDVDGVGVTDVGGMRIAEADRAPEPEATA